MPAFHLDSHVALVTGGAGPLGSAVALALADAGADVAVHDHAALPDGTRSAVRRAGRRAVPITGRLSEIAQGSWRVSSARSASWTLS